jgi:hypothetical protein
MNDWDGRQVAAYMGNCGDVIADAYEQEIDVDVDENDGYDRLDDIEGCDVAFEEIEDRTSSKYELAKDAAYDGLAAMLVIELLRIFNGDIGDAATSCDCEAAGNRYSDDT